MDVHEFRARGKEMIEYICEFISNIKDRRVTPDVGPGYLKPMLPAEPPHQPESWDAIMRDVDSKIMPGVNLSLINFSNFPSQYIYNLELKISRNKFQYISCFGKKR
jgi:hypothetical protein